MSEVTGKAKGGVARAQALSSEERSEIAKKAAEARWNKPPKAQYAGELSIGDLTIGCAVLPDGTRVLSQRGVGRALGRGYGGADWRRSASEDAGGKLPFFMNAKGLIPFISNELMLLVTAPIEYQQNQGGGIAHGIAATALLRISEHRDRPFRLIVTAHFANA